MKSATISIVFYVCASLGVNIVAFLSLALASRHFLLFMVSLEIFYSSVVVFFVISSFFVNNVLGQVFAIFVICLSAAEAVVGFTLAISIFRTYRTLFTLKIHELKN